MEKVGSNEDHILHQLLPPICDEPQCYKIYGLKIARTERIAPVDSMRLNNAGTSEV